MESALAQPRRWTRAEYDRLIDAGIFQPDEHLELLDGEIITVTPQKSRHTTAVHAVAQALGAVFADTAYVRVQAPLALSESSQPEPDVAVVPGSLRDYRDEHPHTALLIVEVADTSLRLDRHTKGPLYARAGLPEYWIVNLNDGILEVYREPVAMGEGWDYRLVQRLAGGDAVSPIAAPGAVVPVRDLLP